MLGATSDPFLEDIDDAGRSRSAGDGATDLSRRLGNRVPRRAARGRGAASSKAPSDVEGRTIRIEYRYADGHYDRLPTLAGDLVGLHADVIVTEGTPPTRAAIQATRTVPVVMTVTGDPVAAGLVTDLTAWQSHRRIVRADQVIE